MAAGGAAVLPVFLTSCDDGESFTAKGEFGFFEGVASFDPSQTNIILWTRYTPASNEINKPEIILDVASDASFNNLVASETVEIDTGSDYTVNVDVGGLISNNAYYYRFRNDRTQAVSATGETKTLPATGEANDVKIAVLSCANLQAGLFNVYGAVAESDVDVVVHMGDYIYEYGEGGYGTNENTATLNRVHEPAGEIIEINEYRTRYRQYRRDEQLQRAHQLKPFITVWDDHEISNDAYKDGAENHQADEGDYETRKMNAIQVWHEYLPARVADNSKIYRSFNLGGIADLMMLDTRIIGRERQLNIQNYITLTGGNIGIDSQRFAQDWQDPNRTILGSEQRNWLINEISGSTARWQVIGSQVLMGKYYVPTELLILIGTIASGGANQEVLGNFNTLVAELLAIKTRIANGDPSVTSAERARVENVLPYNLDSWDGYPAEREAIYAASRGKNLVAIAGDTHNAWYSEMSDAGANRVGVEFATSSVSAPGFEGIFGNDPAVIGGLEQTLVGLVDGLLYSDASRRGYLKITFTEADATAEWNFIGTLATPDTNTTQGNSVTVS